MKRQRKPKPETVITAVFLAGQAHITSEKFRDALRKSQRAGAADLVWHSHDYDPWEGDEISQPERVASMQRLLREISDWTGLKLPA